MNRLLTVAVAAAMLAGCAGGMSAEERAAIERAHENHRNAVAMGVCQDATPEQIKVFGSLQRCVVEVATVIKEQQDQLAALQRLSQQSMALSNAAILSNAFAYRPPVQQVQPGITAQDLNNALGQAFPPPPMQRYTPMP
jgi:hypothetical protein